MDYYNLDLYRKYENILNKKFITKRLIILKNKNKEKIIINPNTIIKTINYYKIPRTILCCIKRQHETYIRIEYNSKFIDYNIRNSNKIFYNTTAKLNPYYLEPYHDNINNNPYYKKIKNPFKFKNPFI